MDMLHVYISVTLKSIELHFLVSFVYKYMLEVSTVVQ